MKASWFKLASCLVPLVFVAATCKREAPPEKPAAPAPSGTTASTAPSEPATPPVSAELPTPRQEDLPGFPVSELPEPAAKQVFAFAQDDFCYCGCPHTVQGCLKEHGGCRHAKRMMLLASAEAVGGAKSAEIAKSLNDYYASFAADKRNTFDLKGVACQGPADAPVTLVEFSDFECPYCKLARPLLEQLVTAEKGKLRLCFKPFPLGVHPHSQPAAEAAMYAKAHGKFWEMHDLLFEKQQSLENADLKTYAQQVGLDGDDLLKAVETQKYQAEINASKEEGKRAGLQGTPAIFLNGRPLILPISPETLAHAIDDELEWKQNNGHWAAD